MSRQFRLDPLGIFSDPHEGAEAAATVRFKEAEQAPEPARRRGRHRGPRKPRRKLTLESVLVRLRFEAWRR